MSPRTQQIAIRVEARPELVELIERAVHAALQSEDPRCAFTSWLTDELEDGNEHSALHACWLPGGDTADLCCHWLDDALETERQIRIDDAKLQRSLRRAY